MGESILSFFPEFLSFQRFARFRSIFNAKIPLNEIRKLFSSKYYLLLGEGKLFNKFPDILWVIIFGFCGNLFYQMLYFYGLSGSENYTMDCKHTNKVIIHYAPYPRRWERAYRRCRPTPLRALPPSPVFSLKASLKKSRMLTSLPLI